MIIFAREGDLAESISLIVFSLLAIGLGVLVYVIPTVVAVKREHPNIAAIAVINILLGWTFVGWAVALAWSLTAIDRKRT